MGRHPAAVGVLDPRPAPARLPARPPACWPRRSTGSTASSSARTTPDGPMRRLEACQSPVWDTCLALIALLDAGCRPTTRRCAAAVDWMLGEEIRGHGRLGRAARPDLDAGRLGVRVRQRRLPRHRRHRRGRAGAATASRTTLPGVEAAVERGIAWVDRHAVARRRLGRLRRRQHPPPGREAAVLRLRRGDRPAVGRRHRARRRDARRTAGWRDAEPARRGVRWLLDAQEADGSWFGRWGANYVYGTGAVVPALVAAGVEPRLDRRSGAPCAGCERAPERRRRLGRGPALLRRRRVARPGRVDAVADRVGAARRCWPSTPTPTAVERGIAWLVRHPAARRRLGRGPLHRHRLPRRLLHQLRDVPAGVPAQRARPVSELRRRSSAMTANAGLLVVTALRSEYAALRRPGARRDRRALRHGPGPGRASGCRSWRRLAPDGGRRRRRRRWARPDAAPRRRGRGQRGARRARPDRAARRRRRWSPSCAAWDCGCTPARS